MLLGQARDWRTAADIRGFVAEIMARERQKSDEGSALDTWRVWALAEADAIDPAMRTLETWSGDSAEDDEFGDEEE